MRHPADKECISYLSTDKPKEIWCINALKIGGCTVGTSHFPWGTKSLKSAITAIIQIMNLSEVEFGLYFLTYICVHCSIHDSNPLIISKISNGNQYFYGPFYMEEYSITAVSLYVLDIHTN